MIVELDDQLVSDFVDWARLQPHCKPDEPLGQLTRLLELQMGRDLVENKRAALLAQGPPRDTCPGCFQSIYDKAAKDGWCSNCISRAASLQKDPIAQAITSLESDYPKAHKVMTPEEYTALVLIGWHKVCKNIDDTGGVGIQYLPQPATTNRSSADHLNQSNTPKSIDVFQSTDFYLVGNNPF